MGTPVPALDRPVVSIIVPARNEEASLSACLESLVSQSGVLFEIIVVDDGSTDRTRAIAESFPGVRVIDPAPLPPGWTGKNNAVVAGARAAKGKWLLFTDADTVHLPGSLARAIAEAEHHHADLLSYSPEQEVHGFWERAVMPVIFAELARKYPPLRRQRLFQKPRGRKRPVPADLAQSLRRGRRSCRRCLLAARGCRPRPSRPQGLPQNSFPLRWGRGAHAHVPRLRANARGLDQESQVAFSSHRLARSLARSRIFSGSGVPGLQCRVSSCR